MSKFFTPIAVDVKAISKLLPEGAFIEAIRWNSIANQIEMVWDHGPYYTGLDFPGDFALTHLEKGTVPAYVRRRDARRPKPAPRTDLRPGTRPGARTPNAKPIAPKGSAGGS